MITAGMEENGQTVAILPGGVLNVMLDAAADGGAWQLVARQRHGGTALGRLATDTGRRPMPPRLPSGAASSASHQARPPSSSRTCRPTAVTSARKYRLTVEVPATEPGSSGAVAVTEADAGNDFALVTGDTLVVRLDANPTTGYDWRVVSTNDAHPAHSRRSAQYAVSSDLTGAGGVCYLPLPGQGRRRSNHPDR